jgi:iron-sulfur cluster repair protein YtfE (RIC family)
MKRAPELRKFSEDHHHGLAHARRLRKAADGDQAHPAADIARDFLGYWQAETSTHFREEEEVLLPVLQRHGGDVSQGSVIEMLAQHAEIRGLIMGLSDEVTSRTAQPETLKRIGEQLEEHIRLEERVVFPMIENILPEEGLKEVASRLETRQTGLGAEPWVPTEGFSYDPWPGPGDSEGGGWD